MEDKRLRKATYALLGLSAVLLVISAVIFFVKTRPVPFQQTPLRASLKAHSPSPDDTFRLSVTYVHKGNITRTSVYYNSYALLWQISEGAEILIDLRSSKGELLSPWDKKKLMLDKKAMKATLIRLLNTVRPIPVPERELLIKLKGASKPRGLEDNTLALEAYTLRDPRNTREPGDITIWVLKNQEDILRFYTGYLQYKRFMEKAVETLGLSDDELERIRRPELSFLGFRFENDWALAVAFEDKDSNQSVLIDVERVSKEALEKKADIRKR